MTVCKFYQQGNCKFGDRCRFEHPARNQPQTNRFGALSGGGNGGGRGNSAQLEKYKLDFDNIEKDLTSEVPQWILSAYAPGRDTPQQLFGGYPREQSFEEMRLHFLEGKAAGNEQAALNQAQEIYQDAQKQMQNAVRNLNDAVQFIVSAENEHPNRHDICREGTQGAPFGEFLVEKRRGGFGSNPQAAANPFSSNSTPAAPSAFGGGAAQTSAFGQPSTMGAKPNPFASTSTSSTFGQPSQASGGGAFGQPAQTQGSAFGQPSTMGAKPNPFGTPAFGQAASATPGGAFGQPSQSQGNAFGQPSQPQGSAFGQPSQMGAKPNPFAANTSTPSANPFSASSAPASTTPAANPFGSQTQAKPNPFAASSNTTPPSNPFAQASPAQGNAFGQPSQMGVKPNPFATPSQSTPAAANPFASGTTQNNAFAQAAQSGGDTMQDAAPSINTNVNSPFASAGQSSGNAFGQSSAAPNPFAVGSTPNTATPVSAVQGAGPYPPDSSKKHPDGYMTKDGFGNLSTFKGQRVIQKDGKPGMDIGGKFVKIWFPDGPPAYNKDTFLPLEAYDQRTLEMWKAFEATGEFKDKVIPDLPPPREATTWDF